MRLLFLLCLLFNGIIISNNSIAVAASIEEGEKVFTANCAACHAGGNNVIMPAKTLKIEALESFSMDSIAAIKNQVTNGKNAMPAFQGRLTGDDIENVANYVLSQSKAGWGDED